MKTRLSFLIVMLLALPLVLAACGGGDADTAKNFVEAVADGDQDEAEKHVCDKNKAELVGGPNDGGAFEVEDLECEEDGDDVTCKFKSNFGVEGVEKSDIEMTFGMEDGKVCERKATKVDGQTVE